jgi:hypothetical protein
LVPAVVLDVSDGHLCGLMAARAMQRLEEAAGEEASDGKKVGGGKKVGEGEALMLTVALAVEPAQALSAAQVARRQGLAAFELWEGPEQDDEDDEDDEDDKNNGGDGGNDGKRSRLATSMTAAEAKDEAGGNGESNNWSASWPAEWGEVRAIVSDCYFEQLAPCSPILAALNFWYLRTAAHALTKARPLLDIVPRRAWVRAVLVEFTTLADAHAPVVDVCGFDHTPYEYVWRRGVAGVIAAAPGTVDAATTADAATAGSAATSRDTGRCGDDSGEKDFALPLWHFQHRVLTPSVTLLEFDYSQPIHFSEAGQGAGAAKAAGNGNDRVSPGEYARAGKGGTVRVNKGGVAHAVAMFVDYDASTDDSDGIIHGFPPSPGIHHSQQWVRWLTPDEQTAVSPGKHELQARASLDVLSSKVSASFRLVGT